MRTAINKAMLEVHKHFANNYRVQIMHVTGKNEYDFVKNGLVDLGVNLDKVDNINNKIFKSKLLELLNI